MSRSGSKRGTGISRRKFLKGLGITSIGIAAGSEGLLGAFHNLCETPAGRVFGPEATEIALEVNGKTVRVRVEPRTTLVEALRDGLHLTGTKIGCDRGACGACTVIVGERIVASCLTLAMDAIGKPVWTIEGMARDGRLHRVQQAFVEADAMQCGFCTPGMVMSCKHLLDRNPRPTLDEIRQAVSGNLCRCGTYPKVFEAVIAAMKS